MTYHSIPLPVIEALNEAYGSNEWQGDASPDQLFEPAVAAIRSLADREATRLRHVLDDLDGVVEVVKHAEGTPLSAFVKSTDAERGAIYERVIPMAIEAQRMVVEESDAESCWLSVEKHPPIFPLTAPVVVRWKAHVIEHITGEEFSVVDGEDNVTFDIRCATHWLPLPPVRR